MCGIPFVVLKYVIQEYNPLKHKFNPYPANVENMVSS